METVGWSDYREIRKVTDPGTAPLWLSIINSGAELPSETVAQLAELEVNKVGQLASWQDEPDLGAGR